MPLLRGRLLLLLLAGAGACVAQELPHVDTCYFCHKCWYTKDRDPDARPTATVLIGGTPEEDQGATGAAKIVPGLQDWRAKKIKPNCTECWGCTTTLTPLKEVQAFGHNFAVETGASPDWLFHAEAHDTHSMGRRVIVKVFCLPIDKTTGLMKIKPCDTTEVSVRGAQHLVALDRVTYECGMTDITIRTWLAPVNAIMSASSHTEGSGLHIFWYGIWMERAPGLSLNQLAYIHRKDMVENVILTLLQEKMNKTQVVRAALYDLLIAQCDRHAQNVFIDEAGNLKLIDNLNSLRFSWKHCSQDSIFLPGTQKNEIIRFGGNLVSKRLMATKRRNLNPIILTDYRCWTQGGRLGTNYPPELEKCMRKMSAMSPVELKRKYGFTDTYIAEVLVTRSADMLAQGYEWTLKRGKPVNLPPLRYRWHPPCCKVELNQQHTIQCAHPWNVTAEFPRGDPLRGASWQWTYADPGTYDGDKLWSKRNE